MLFYGSGKDKDVVQVDYHYTLSNEISEDIIDYCLEDGQAVGYSKEHYKRLKQTTVGVKDSLPLIVRFDMNVIKPLLDVKLGKVLGSAEL